MILYVDTAIVKMLSDIFEVPYEAFYYGPFNAALNSHIRKTYSIDDISKRSGEIVLPFLAWQRTPSTDPDRKDVIDSLYYRDGSVGKNVEFLYVFYNYTIEVLTDAIIEQNDHFRNFLFKFAKRPALVYNFRGEELHCKLEVDDPQDTTELDEEEDLGRRVRTTYTFRVQVPLFREKIVNPPANNILLSTNQYYPTERNLPYSDSLSIDKKDSKEITKDVLGDKKPDYEELNKVSQSSTKPLTEPGAKSYNIKDDMSLGANTDDFIFIE